MCGAAARLLFDQQGLQELPEDQFGKVATQSWGYIEREEELSCQEK